MQTLFFLLSQPNAAFKGARNDPAGQAAVEMLLFSQVESTGETMCSSPICGIVLASAAISQHNLRPACAVIARDGSGLALQQRGF